MNFHGKKHIVPVTLGGHHRVLHPGGALYNTMYAAVFQDWAGCKSYGFQTLQATLGIAIGISFVSAVLHMLTNLAHRRASKK